MELRNQTHQLRVVQVDLERLQQLSGILGVRTNTKYRVSLKSAWVLWSCATGHTSPESSKSISKNYPTPTTHTCPTLALYILPLHYLPFLYTPPCLLLTTNSESSKSTPMVQSKTKILNTRMHVIVTQP